MALTSKDLSFATADLPDSTAIRLARSRDSLTRGDVMINEEVATSAETEPATMAPQSPAAAPIAAYLGPSGAKAKTPEAIQTGKVTIEAIAPALISWRHPISLESVF